MHSMQWSGGPTRQAGRAANGRPARLQRSRTVVKAADTDEIDPTTGSVIATTSSFANEAGFSVQAGGLKWAYRKAEANPANAKPGTMDLLLLHGLGSSSYVWRNTLELLAQDGVTAYAPDWIGHGDSDKPAAGGAFKYDRASYIAGLKAFVDAVGIKKPFGLVVQGFVLSQYGLLYALENEADIARLMILNTPLGLNSKLRPELAAYKSPLPFLRPGNKPFEGMLFNMQGSPYAMLERDALAFGRPYREQPEASASLAAAMDALDFPALLKEVDQVYESWRKPSLLLFGNSDPFIDVRTTFDFLDTKRTTMKVATATAKLGHMPQEDFPAAVHDVLIPWVSGESDEWKPGQAVKMTKKGVVSA